MECPSIVLEKYAISPDAEIKPLGQNFTNFTYLVPSQKIILQRINPILASANKARQLMNDFESITNIMRNVNWIAPRLILSNTGDKVVFDENGNAWRAMTALEGRDLSANDLIPTIVQEAGELLALFSRRLQGFNFKPKFFIPHFHDTLFFVEKLSRILARQGKHIKKKVVGNYTDYIFDRINKKYKTIIYEVRQSNKLQVIHGDPKIRNFFVTRDSGLTLIDFDTVMIAPIYYDIGDALRSFCSQGPFFDLYKAAMFLQGYLKYQHFSLEEAALIKYSPTILALELSARFFIDFFEEKYFGLPHHILLGRGIRDCESAQASEASEEEIGRIVKRY